MRRLPLALAAHPSSWRLDRPGAEGEAAAGVFARDRHTCRFCGLCAVGRQEVFHLDGDHDDEAADNLATACPLCHDCQHLGREGIEQDHALAWLPEVSQAALNHLVRAVHVALHAHGEAAHMAERPVRDNAVLRAAYATHRALAGRIDTARRRIGTASPREFGAALLGLPPVAAARRAELVGGLRLLSRGRLHRDGADVYPDLLDAWTAEGGPLRDILDVAEKAGRPGGLAALRHPHRTSSRPLTGTPP